jgi:tetratricopeptide (TPR) repeat protein
MTYVQLSRSALCAVILLVSAAGSRAELAPDAQQAISKGIIAARQQDYLLAIRYFQDARKIAPDAPEIYYDLGLAASKIPGRELRAIAWFGAYLAANPSAPNAAAVKGEIDTLDVRGQSNVSRLIKSVQDAASQARDDQEAYLGQVAGLWAEAGDMAAATKTIDRIQVASRKSGARASIAEGQTEAGDFAGALKTAEQIQEPDTKSGTLVTIALAQNRAHDVAGAVATLALARKAADQIKDAQVRHGRLESIAHEQADFDDIAGAQNTVAAVGSPLKNWPDDSYYIDLARQRIVLAQLRAGDIAGAQKTAGLIPAKGARLKEDAQKAIEEAIKKGGSSRPVVVAASKPATVPAIAASDWLSQLDYELSADPFLDLAGYLKGQHSDNPQALLSALKITAEKIIKAQNVIDRMLKQQTTQKIAP